MGVRSLGWFESPDRDFVKFSGKMCTGGYRNLILWDLDGRNERFRSIAFQKIKNFENRFSRQKVMVDGSWLKSGIFGKSELGLGSHRQHRLDGDSLVKLDFGFGEGFFDCFENTIRN